MANPNFNITGGTGFQMEFLNGYKVSVQFGPGNYSTNRDRPWDRRGDMWESANAEVAVIAPNGDWATKEAFKEIFHMDLPDDVAGWVTPDDVAKVMSWAAGS